MDAEEPLRPDSRFSVEVARLIDGRPDPSTNRPPGNPESIDVLACLETQEQLDRILG